MLDIDEIEQGTIEKNKFVYAELIYRHFINLIKFPYVKHTKQSIYELLSSDNLFGYIVKNDKKIIAYLFGEYQQVKDGRNVYYLSYVYVSNNYRNKHIGSLLMKLLITHCKKIGIPFIILTYDSYDKKLTLFYKKLGFIVDPVLRNGNRHEILCLYV